MGFLEKMGLVERDEGAPIILPDVADTSSIDVDAQISEPVNIVCSIYEQNEIADRSNSIYTVKALIDTLPPEMTTAKKQGTVSGILAVSGKAVADLLKDAENRIAILNAAQDKIVEHRTDEINEANADIEELKRAIEAATMRIKEAEDIIGATKKSVEDEIAVIDGLVTFCNGMEAQK